MINTKFTKPITLLLFIFISFQMKAQNTNVEYRFTDMYNYNKLTEDEKATIEQETNELLTQKEAANDEAEIEQLNWEIYRRCQRHLLKEAEVNYIIQQLKIVEEQVTKTRKKPSKWIKK